MAVENLTDTMWVGNKRIQKFTVTDEDASGSPAKDLTGLTIKWALSNIDPNSGAISTTAVLEKATGGNGITITDAVNGKFEVTIDPGDTSDLAPGVYYFEAEVFDTTPDPDEPVVVATGKLTIKLNVVNTL